MGLYLLALSFLTVLPLRINYIATEEQMRRTLYFYPLVGLTIGGIVATVSYFGHLLKLDVAGDALTVVALILITGGLHLDGLMDTADGIMSGKDRDRKLEIMKDSRVGAMGVLACVSVVLLKVTLLAIIPYPYKFFVLMVMPVAGRWSFVLGITVFPYARKKPGLGGVFGREHEKGILYFTTLLFFLIGFLFLSWQGVVVAAAIIILTILLNKKICSLLGGLTGDTYGAVGEIVETLFLFMVVLVDRVVSL